MQSELKELRKELNKLLAGNDILKQAVREVSKIDMTKASLVVRNPKHEIVAVDKILDGELPGNVPVGDYVFLQNFTDVIKLVHQYLAMGNSIDKYLLIKAHRILSENPEGGYRKSNPVLYSYKHVPPHRADIESLLSDMLRNVYGNDAVDDVILKAMYIHNSTISIYPFDEYSGEIAVLALNYILMENGFMPVSMPIKREEYLDMTAACLKGKNQEKFYNFLYEAVRDRMVETIEACKAYA